jgi:hypothetical protein
MPTGAKIACPKNLEEEDWSRSHPPILHRLFFESRTVPSLGFAIVLVTLLLVGCICLEPVIGQESLGTGLASSPHVEVFQTLGGWIGESVSPSGVTLTHGLGSSAENSENLSEALKIASAQILSTGEIEISLLTEISLSLVVQVSSDLESWTTLGTFSVRAGKLTFFDPSGISAGSPQRFYRLRVNL